MKEPYMRRWLWVLVMMFMGAGWAGAVRPAEPPSEALVARLIAEESEVVASTINVAVILDGESKLEGDFLTSDAVHVHFVWTVLVDGRRVRQTAHRTFFWNQKYGWFIFRTVHPRGGEAIDICSEKLGMLRLR